MLEFAGSMLENDAVLLPEDSSSTLFKYASSMLDDVGSMLIVNTTDLLLNNVGLTFKSPGLLVKELKTNYST